MKKFRLIPVLVLLFCVLSVLAGFFTIQSVGFANASVEEAFEAFEDEPAVVAQADLWDELAKLLWPKEKNKDLDKVILGGIPIGISLEDRGVQIIGFSDINAESGKRCPATESGLKVGDRIISLDGKKVTKVSELSSIADKSGENPLAIEYLRNGKIENAQITPVKDLITRNYRLGVLAKESCNGIGTLTFVRSDLTFGCLGHPMTISGTNDVVEIDGGSVYDSKIFDIKKGTKGGVGELKGAFASKNPIGVIYKNNKFGVYGKYSVPPKNLILDKTVSVMQSSEIKPGRAQILSTVNGETPKYYEIEIVKVSTQSEKDDKGLVIRVTDKELLSITGGIVQGMSGSPIVQNGKLAGAVTHVFINDPTRGYGIFAEWMLGE